MKFQSNTVSKALNTHFTLAIRVVNKYSFILSIDSFWKITNEQYYYNNMQMQNLGSPLFLATLGLFSVIYIGLQLEFICVENAEQLKVSLCKFCCHLLFNFCKLLASFVNSVVFH